MASKKLRRSPARPKSRVTSAGKVGTKRKAMRPAAAPEGVPFQNMPFPIVGVGASAGGFEAFREFLKALPRDTGFAFVLVQHLDPGHESMLTKLLSKSTAMSVTEVREGMQVEPDHVYVIPPNATMSIKGGMLHLVAGRKSAEKHMPIDHFLRTLSEDRGSRAIGVILSGTASDGTMGLKAIKAEGGITFAQDSKSAKYDGMPRSAVAAGCVDFVLPPGEIAIELARIGRHPYLGAALRAREAPEAEPEGDTDLHRIYTLLRTATGVDFAFYKTATIKRRVLRRMVLHKSESLKPYLKYLQQNAAELEALYEDILIHVTGFFREPEAFDSLQAHHLPKVLSAKPKGEPIRVWVPGCSTGEEAYSIAIMLLEFLGDRATSTPIQIFGTDISEASIEKARTGIYTEGSVSDVSPERLRRFFGKSNGGYQISKTVREMCVFARQDLGKDPPFSRLDLISCRNVLIYMGSVLQKKVIAIFHYALRPTGYLMLGKSETISGSADFFTLVDRKHKIYAKKSADVRPAFDVAAGFQRIPAEEVRKPQVPVPFDVQREADRIVLGQYAPAGLIVNENLQILHFRGQCSPYLAPTPGEASLGLLRMVRPEFAVELRTALHRSRKQELPVRKEAIRVRRNGRQYHVALDVIPFKGGVGERYFLVLFSDTPLAEPAVAKPARGWPGAAKAEAELDHLRREMMTTKEYLQSIIEEQEATNEELKSANEEVLSSNEELQSTNEELETAKEELQSANEELVTVNEQMQTRNAELAQVNDDLANLLSGVNIPIVMLGNDRCIRRFTPQAERLLNLLPADVGRPIDNIRSNVEVPELGPLISEVLETVSVRHREVQDHEGRWYSLVLRPYRTLDNKIDGVVMIFIDIDALKRTQMTLESEQKFTAAVLEAAGTMVLVTDFDGRIIRFNRACQRLTGYSYDEVNGRPTWDLLLVPEEMEQVKAVYRRIFQEAAPVEHENRWQGRDGQIHLISWTSAPMTDAAGTPQFVVRVGFDVTDSRRIARELSGSEAELRASQEQLRTLTAHLIAAQEDERGRVSRELHDGVMQQLAALVMEASALQRTAPGGELQLVKGLAEMEERLTAVVADIRQTAHQLHPAVLEHLGLAAALRSLCDDFSRQQGIKVKLTAQAPTEAMAAGAALSLYRIVQEALQNTGKHAGAEVIRVSLTARDGATHLSISDDGRGFDVAHVRHKGLGLISMEERVRQMGGTFALKSASGEGTRIDIEIPAGSAGSATLAPDPAGR